MYLSLLFCSYFVVLCYLLFCSCFVLFCYFVVVLCYFYCFLCTSVGLLPPGESPIAISKQAAAAAVVVVTTTNSSEMWRCAWGWRHHNPSKRRERNIQQYSFTCQKTCPQQICYIYSELHNTESSKSRKKILQCQKIKRQAMYVERNADARSRNHWCREKAITVT